MTFLDEALHSLLDLMEAVIEGDCTFVKLRLESLH